MRQRLRDTDFLYLSTRLRAAENSLVGKEKLARLAEAKDFSEAYSLACEMYGVQMSDFGTQGYEKMLSAELEKAYAFATELVDGTIDTDNKPFELLESFRFVYDCQNIKACIKCEAVGKDARPMLSENGSVDANKALVYVGAKDFSVFPENMAKAAPYAIEQLAATGDPQELDLILDKAAFADMMASAQKSGLDYLVSLMKTKIDSVNIGMCLRCIRQNKNKAYFKKLYIPGGTLDEDFFISNYDETPAKLLNAVSYTEYSDISKYAEQRADTLNLSHIEKLAEEIYAQKAYSVKSVPFGAELVVCYIVQKEYEIKNVRIVLAGKACGLDGERIKERLRAVV